MHCLNPSHALFTYTTNKLDPKRTSCVFLLFHLWANSVFTGYCLDDEYARSYFSYSLAEQKRWLIGATRERYQLFMEVWEIGVAHAPLYTGNYRGSGRMDALVVHLEAMTGLCLNGMRLTVDESEQLSAGRGRAAGPGCRKLLERLRAEISEQAGENHDLL